MNRLKRNRFWLILLMTVFISLPSEAIKFVWDVDFSTLFDNREGSHSHLRDRTFLMSSLSTAVGIQFSDYDRIMAGAVWVQPLTDSFKEGRITPTIYYRRKKKEWGFAMGIFPRTLLTHAMPEFLWSDSCSYYSRNIKGMLIDYTGRHGYAEVYLDWRGLQSRTEREAFNIVGRVEAQPGGKIFIAGAHLMMNHYARTMDAPDEQSIVDNFLINPYVGVNLSNKTPLDSLTVRAGMLMTVERDRGEGDWKLPAGGWMEIIAEWKWLGLRNSFYRGGELFQLYHKYRASLYQGEAFYSGNFYNRLNIYARIIRTRYVSLTADLGFHFSSRGFMFNQRAIVTVNLPTQTVKGKGLISQK